MREIGGYFELETIDGKEYYPDLIAINTGRNALEYIIRAKSIKKIYIPYYLCDSVSNLCDRVGCIYDYYHIDKDFKPIFNEQLGRNEYIYIVNYFGQLSSHTIKKYKEQFVNLIVDNVQAFFQKPLVGVDTIYSCRKFFGVPDGAYLSTDTVLHDSIGTEISNNRMTHLLGRAEGTASEYYAYFKDNDKSFKEEPLKKMSVIAHNILRGINYNRVKEQREKNFAFLHSRLGRINGLSVRECEGPYAYPFLCSHGGGIKRQLAQKGIYIATLWPNVLSIEDCLEKNYASDILPLPCDQRYDLEDMKYILEELAVMIGDIR